MTVAARSRREEILAAAEREFATAGYAGGRVERIAASAGVNKQLLFHYYGSKDGLFSSAVSALLSRLEPPQPIPSQPVEAIRAILSAVQGAIRRVPGILPIAADAGANELFPREAGALIRAWIDRHRERLRQAIADGQASGHFRDDIDPGAVAAIALAAALGSGVIASGQGGLPISTLVIDYCAWR